MMQLARPKREFRGIQPLLTLIEAQVFSPPPLSSLVKHGHKITKRSIALLM
jgi:hypothetical protein